MSKARVDEIRRGSLTIVVLFEIVTGAITCLALADLLFGLGQGHTWDDVLAGGGMMAFGVALWLVPQGIFRFVSDNY